MGGRFTTDDDDSLAASGTDPVFGRGTRLGGGGAGTGEKEVGSLGLDHLGKVSRAQGDGVDDQLAAELIGCFGLLFLETEEPVGETAFQIGILHLLHEIVVHLLHLFEGLHGEFIPAVALHLGEEGLPPLEEGGHDDAGGLLHLLGEGKAFGEALAAGTCGPVPHEGDTGVAHGVDAGGNP